MIDKGKDTIIRTLVCLFDDSVGSILDEIKVISQTAYHPVCSAVSTKCVIAATTRQCVVTVESSQKILGVVAKERVIRTVTKTFGGRARNCQAFEVAR